MELFKTEEKIIVRPDGGSIAAETIDKLLNGECKNIRAGEFIRMEHPHCAFFKSSHVSNEEELLRKTLYTPEGRLHIDFKTEEGKEIQVDKFVKKKEQLDTLLFYLRDVEIKPALMPDMPDFEAIEMPKTPMAEFISYTQEDIFKESVSDYEITLKHIFSQLRRIYNAKIEILAQKVIGKAEYAIFEDISLDVADDLLERWHYYYIRKARLLKQ